MSEKENKELNQKDLEQVAGGQPGYDAYNKYEYDEAGITWTHYNNLKRDTYTINVNGVEVNISQKQAENMVKNWRGNHKKRK